MECRLSSDASVNSKNSSLPSTQSTIVNSKTFAPFAMIPGVTNTAGSASWGSKMRISALVLISALSSCLSDYKQTCVKGLLTDVRGLVTDWKGDFIKCSNDPGSN